jgi:hypothetical protein
LGRLSARPSTTSKRESVRAVSLQIWQDYFGRKARVVAVDIDPRCRALEAEGSEVFIGDQGNPAFLSDLAERTGPFDIIIDDGSHRMEDLRTSFMTLFPALKSSGLYSVEDTHTFYMADSTGGYRVPVTFIENAKKKSSTECMRSTRGSCRLRAERAHGDRQRRSFLSRRRRDRETQGSKVRRHCSGLIPMFWSLKNKGIRHISANGLLHL